MLAGCTEQTYQAESSQYNPDEALAEYTQMKADYERLFKETEAQYSKIEQLNKKYEAAIKRLVAQSNIQKSADLKEG